MTSLWDSNDLKYIMRGKMNILLNQRFLNILDKTFPGLTIMNINLYV